MCWTCSRSKVPTFHIHISYVPEAKMFRPCGSMMCRFQNSEKSGQNDIKWAGQVCGKKYPRSYLSPKAKFSSLFLYDVPFVSLDQSQRKVHRVALTYSRPQVPMPILHMPPMTIFSSVSSVKSRFQVTAHCGEKYTKWQQIDLDLLEVKSTHISYSQIVWPRGSNKIFVSFALLWTVFELWSNV